jgi:UDP-N-acetylmuramoyl-L-alanyl-D-glutamate--2,6-diaminopimelate ligase
MQTSTGTDAYMSLLPISSILKNTGSIPGFVDWSFPPGISLNDLDRNSTVRIDSRKCKSWDVFVALKGTVVDGHDYVSGLLAAGTFCVVEQDFEISSSAKFSAGILRVRDTREFLSWICAKIYDLANPILKVIGVTGTNGKTSTTWILHQILKNVDANCGLCGTIVNRVGSQQGIPAVHTTEDPLSLGLFSNDIKEAGGKHLVMEVSSHAIHQQRHSLFNYQAAIFTNLSQEHLDYHGRMEDYFQVKASFIHSCQDAIRIICIDDKWGLRLAEELQAADCITFGFTQSADWVIMVDKIGVKTQDLLLKHNEDEYRFELPLIGDFNASNSAAAIICAFSFGMSETEIRGALLDFEAIPGRMEAVNVASEFSPVIVIDYAHTPDGYEKCFESLETMSVKNRYCVFGCGGDRDKSKRSIMTQTALKYFDHVWLTTDNPRTENQDNIFDDMLVEIGRLDKLRVTLTTDRAEAIRDVLRKSQPEDLVLLLGKGHETYQLMPEGKIPFDERNIVRSFYEN